MTLRKRINLGTAVDAAREDEKAKRVPRWRLFYQRNRERILSRRKTYRLEHRDEICEYCRNYMRERREKESESTEEIS